MEKYNLTLTLLIPDVSLLLVYKDNWNKAKVMRKVIAELLKNGFYKEIPTTDKTEIQCSHHLLGLEDCAIISLELTGDITKEAAKNPKMLFAKALDNFRNVLRFDSSMLSEIHKITYIKMALKLLQSQPLKIADSHAA